MYKKTLNTWGTKGQTPIENGEKTGKTIHRKKMVWK